VQRFMVVVRLATQTIRLSSHLMPNKKATLGWLFYN